MPLDNTQRAARTVPAYTARRMNAIDWIALLLMIAGGINWGLVRVFGIDLVASIFGAMTLPSRAIYALVGIAAIYGIVLAAKQASRDTAVMA